MESRECIEALILACPTTLDVDQIQEASSQCPVCKIIHAQLEEGSEKAKITSTCTLVRISRADWRAFGCIIPILTVEPNLQSRSRFLQIKVCIFCCLRMTLAVDFEVIESGKADFGQ
jgi:hypothetical protein